MEVKRKIDKIEYGSPLLKIYINNMYSILMPEFTGDDEVKPILCNEFCDDSINGNVTCVTRFVAMLTKEDVDTFINYLKDGNVKVVARTYSDNMIFEKIQKSYYHYVRNGKKTIPTERNNDMRRVNAIDDEKLLVYSYDKMRVTLAYLSYGLMLGIKCTDPIVNKYMDFYGFKPVTLLNYFPNIYQIFGKDKWIKEDNYQVRYQKLFDPASMDYKKKYKFLFIGDYETQQNKPYVALEYDNDNVVNVAIGESIKSLVDGLPIYETEEDIECLSIHPHQLLSTMDKIYINYINNENDHNRLRLIPYHDNSVSGYFKVYSPDKLKLAELRLKYANELGLNRHDTFMSQLFYKKKKKIVLPNDKDWKEFISDKEINTIPGTNILMIAKKTNVKPTSGRASLPHGSMHQIVDSINEFYEK